MATQAEDAGHRPAPGLARALLAVLTMVVTTGVLSGLIYVLMLGIAATSQGRPEGEASPSPVAAQPRAAQPAQPTVPSQPISPPPQTK